MRITFYNTFTRFCGNNTVDLDSDTFGCSLLTSSYTVDKDHDFRNDTDAFEIPATGGYTAGGVTLTGVTFLTTTGANGFTTFTFANPTWNPLTASNIQHALIYKRRGGASSADELCFVWTATNPISPNATQFTIVVPPTGAFRHLGI